MIGALLGTRSELEELIRFVVRKKIRPVIDFVFPLKDAKKAQSRMESNLHKGKILLECVK
jgi:D-arabinose 1-dehydrogenase-like Zn-dependent alcohol dehydrogenase